ncbi:MULTISPECIES: type II toxin-antitoxin system RelE/ParE family toxin [unclassified Oceanobacter]|uniref:type II toxin-antitoxin system RelE/ParE family toxin n=1 Tax=unclassified Oceanobacter TaxID=2620260 RepID=UPI002734B175|nr:MULTISPECIES: type II toxin-antitoxin system RelE/ParE family toxin [unclassified Oceanobacter]MDP2506444.1 type II toxin-antitoxin system RelE/ParE family toxin [Oceanobacter sp. 3_MG-2023]MDP2548995.1 type II toxin-antitoxin system RelE/ParE family toxin [Oceanobacter sp. 4_MG-2023]MDP2609181.1 type II toxin-antitoxin system RelE/ParE family toxin [Oceanobacter sp. 1_MG-2023]MDP2612527.1 type II toxin-antitoxin system RelE/ParE family toxin [Oceanobacter sp. 2_MG-2023]
MRHPDAGRIVPEFGLNHIRELIHSPFRVVYLRQETDVVLIRVWRSERQLELPES